MGCSRKKLPRDVYFEHVTYNYALMFTQQLEKLL